MLNKKSGKNFNKTLKELSWPRTGHMFAIAIFNRWELKEKSSDTSKKAKHLGRDSIKMHNWDFTAKKNKLLMCT